MGSVLGHETEPRDESIDRTEAAGREMYLEYNCSYELFNGDNPLMFPQAPLPKFVDKFPDDNLTKREQKELEQQRQYEAEVKVYKTLQMVLPPVIVLHGFRYTHAQYKMFVSDHTECQKKDQDEEGECDFLIIHFGFIGILEVKAPDLRKESSKSKIFANNFKESKKQRKRTLNLIEGICKTMKVEPSTTFSFTVFGDVEKHLVESIPSYHSLSADEKEELLFVDDINILRKLVIKLHADTRPRVKSKLFMPLLGLWNLNSTSENGPSNKVDLEVLINDLDCRLKASQLTRVPSGRPASSNIFDSPRVFMDLGIKNLTLNQMKIFKSDNLKLWINGPAGSGKTILIAGKVADLVLNRKDEKAAIFVTNKIVAEKYLCFFRQSNVPTIFHVIGDKLTDSHLTSDCSVHIIYHENKKVRDDWDNPRRLTSLDIVLKADYHVFLDDFHNYTEGSPSGRLIVDRVFSEFNSPSSKVFWVTYDQLQDGYTSKHDRSSFFMRKIISNVPIECFMSLSANLRNTFEIASLLAEIRIQRMGHEKEYIATRRHYNDDTKFSEEEYKRFHDVMSLDQTAGHYIHGPMPKLFSLVDNESNKPFIIKQVAECLRSELTRLGQLDKVDIAVVVNFDRVSVKGNHDKKTERFYKNDQIKWRELCNDVIDGIDANSSTKLKASVHFFDETLSAEWPAVIGIVEMSKAMYDDFIHCSSGNTMANSSDIMDKLLARLYITVSRARVYCSIILVLRDLKRVVDVNWGLQSLEVPFAADVEDKTNARFLASIVDLSKVLKKHMIHERKPYVHVDDNEIAAQSRVMYND